jgi:magnesium transporter
MTTQAAVVRPELPTTEHLPPDGEHARAHLATSVPVAAAADTAQGILLSLRGRHFECADPVMVVDADRRLSGCIPLSRLIEAEPNCAAGELMERDPPAVDLDTDQERVASIALHHDLTAVPVLDRDRKLAGVVPTRALLAILRREHVEDLHRLAGIVHQEMRVREAMEAPPVRRARHRLPWLALGFAGSVLAALLMAQFETLLAANVAVAFFVPAIVYLADAIGTQTEAITVRGLSLSHARLGPMLAGELRTGALIGALLGAMTGLAAWTMADPRLALAVGVSVFAASAIATTIGLALPWLLDRLGRDPAYGSGPLATIIQDLLSVAVYLLVVSTLLR